MNTTKTKSIKCKKCDESFFTKFDCRNHDIVVHEKVKPWVCLQCPAVFKKEKLLYQHTRNQHSGMEFKSACNVKNVLI